MMKYLGDETFGDFFRRLRKASGFRWQKDLADASGVSQTTISRIEDNSQKPQPDTLKELSKALNVSYTELMVLAGHWDESELLEPIDKNKIINSATKEQNEIKESSPPHLAEKELSEIMDELEKLPLTYKGHVLTDQEKEKLIAILRSAAEMIDRK